MNPWFFSWPTWASEGRAPHARDDGITPTEMSPLFGHSPVANSSIITTCLGLRPALPRGRAERVPPRKSPFALSPGFPRKAIRPWLAHPSEGRAPHARNDGTTPTPTLPPFGHRLLVNSSGGNGMPRLAYGLATRARRPHPSEKIALRVVPGFSPRGHPTLAGPPLGGAGSARPRGTLALDRGICPLGQKAFICPR